MERIGPIGEIVYAHKKHFKNRIMVGIPTTGIVRYEWVAARYNQVIPCNWSQAEFIYAYASWSPVGFQVANARNIIASAAVREGYQWLLFIDHDTCPPVNMLVTMNDYMTKGDIPVVCGLYFTKSVPADPLIYRGFGTGSFKDWKFGDKIWASGIPMGCTLINCDIFRAMQPDVPEDGLRTMQGREIMAHRYFVTPAEATINPDGTWSSYTGTEDLYWCKKVIEGNYLAKAGFPKVAKKEFPFLVDTNIFCRHIDMDGIQYTSRGEEREFMRKKKK